jgi:hypothetical protein
VIQTHARMEERAIGILTGTATTATVLQLTMESTANVRMFKLMLLGQTTQK